MSRWGIVLTCFLAASILLTGCQVLPKDVTVSTGPSVNVGPVAVAVTINSNGDIVLSGNYSQSLIGIKGLASLNWEFGFEKTLYEAQNASNQLFILYQDNAGEVFQAQYDIGQPFKVEFSQEQWVTRVQSSGNGSIVAYVKQRMQAPASADSMARDFTPVNSCSGASPQRVQVNDTVRVCTKVDHLIVRVDPKQTGTEIRRLNPGETLKVLAGPECADSSLWFFVRSDHYNIKGWVREGSDNQDPYFICSQ
jgi:hypothetical protein